MKPYLFYLTLGLCLLLFNSCEVAPKPIAYGQSSCAHCNMIVSDARYGAEMVTKKGKAYFFDSIECLASYLHDHPEQQLNAELLLVTDFTRPNELIDARKAIYLQSPNLPSPMGMFMTAFAEPVVAGDFQQEHSGRVLTWQEAVSAVERNERPQ